MAEMGERVELVNGEVCDDERLNRENGVCLTCSAGGAGELWIEGR